MCQHTTKEQPVPRKKTNQIPTLSRTINVRLPMILEDEIRDACKSFDFSTSHFCRTAIKRFLAEIKGKKHLYGETL
jgi:hypothetical protein